MKSFASKKYFNILTLAVFGSINFINCDEIKVATPPNLDNTYFEKNVTNDFEEIKNIIIPKLDNKCIEKRVDNNCEIRKITPPKLDIDHLGKHVICIRPMRKGCPNMSVEEIDSKIVAHNYGHGGSGLTLAPGSASFVNSLMIEKYNSKLNVDTPITIIGAGALGLFSAYDLVQKGFKKITIIAKEMEDLTSHNAGGLLAPVSMNNSPEMQKVINKIGIEAYKFYEAIAKKNPESILKEGAKIVPTYFRTRKESGLEPYVGLVMQPAKDVILDFQNGTTQKMVAYDDGIFIDIANLMKSLTNYLKPHVTFVKKEINSFSEVETKFIINCTGLGSKELNKDNELVPVQGHLIMLKDQNPADLNYMILVYFDEAKTKHGQKVKRSFYFFPKELEGFLGVVGGTFIEGATKSTPNKREFKIMLHGAKKFYGIN